MNRKKKFSTTRMIAFGFLTGIVIGTLLLMLPISSKSGEVTNIIDAMFTATTSICVTGLVTVNTVTHWSVFGKFVILLLIQFGGLGIVTFTTTIFLVMRKRITLTERLLIQDAYNLDTLRGLVRLTIKILKGTLVIEGIGALLYSLQFIPEFGFIEGVCISVFTSVSAFCNAGIDLIGSSGFVPYLTNPLINTVTMMLIILGGIGFPVWWDVVNVFKNRNKKEISLKNMFRKLGLHAKIAISMTVILIFVGAIMIFILEYDNAATIGKLPLGDKIMASLFQSVTTRTAGFATISQENFTSGASFVSLLLMFVGGSPSGTAGGVKTVTVAVVMLAVICIVQGKKETEVFHRKVTDAYLKRGLAVISISFVVLIASTVMLSIVEDLGFLDILYETVSALATVGLSRNVTGTLGELGKIIIIITMYLGRIGPITLALAFNSRRNAKKTALSLPEEKILVG